MSDEIEWYLQTISHLKNECQHFAPKQDYDGECTEEEAKCNSVDDKQRVLEGRIIILEISEQEDRVAYCCSEIFHCTPYNAN